MNERVPPPSAAIFRPVTSIRALKVSAAGVKFESAIPPTVQPGEALIRPTRLAVASPDLDVLSGRIRFAGVMGHEFVGVVEKAPRAPGRDEQSRWEGKRVVGLPASPCGGCDLCRAGLAAHCPKRTVIGLCGRDGCFAERFTLPVANLVEVPRQVDDDRAIFAYAIGAALHAVRMIRIEGKPYVSVLGDGPVGLVAAQAAARLNASVRLLGKHAAKFQLCERWGIKHRHESEVGRRHDQDVVLDCTGSPEGFSLALGLVRPRGKIILKTAPGPVPLAALAPRAAGVDLASAVANEIEIHGASGCSLTEAMSVLAFGGIEVLSMISKRFRFADALAAIDAARGENAVKVLMEP